MLHYFGILKPPVTPPAHPGQQIPLFGGSPVAPDDDRRLSPAERSAVTLNSGTPGNSAAEQDDPLSERLAEGRFVSLMLPPYF